MTAVLLPRTESLDFTKFGFRFTRLTESRWRVVQPTGAVVGYLDENDATCTVSRMTADRRSFVQLGEFDSFEEAVAALRWM